MPYKDKEKKKEYDKQWYLDHKEYRKQYKINNRERDRRWRLNNKERIRENDKRYAAIPEHKEHKKEYMKQYYAIPEHAEQKKEQRREYNKQQRKNPQYQLNHNMRKAIGEALKGNKNGYRWEDLVGYTVEDLMKHLKSTIPEGYSWQDYLNGKLHIDHIIPKSVFNYDNYNQIDFHRCWALENLQLLLASKNCSKQDKLYQPFQPALKI
jgi:5-methylcytosine-specific restriction endonuclease McrA